EAKAASLPGRSLAPLGQRHVAAALRAEKAVSGPFRPSDGQMDPGQVKKPRVFRRKPVRWPDMAFGHLTLRNLTRLGSGVSRRAGTWLGGWRAEGAGSLPSVVSENSPQRGINPFAFLCLKEQGRNHWRFITRKHHHLLEEICHAP